MVAVCVACRKGAWLHCLPMVPDGLRHESERVRRLSGLSRVQ
jgi:hypothetical protein